MTRSTGPFRGLSFSGIAGRIALAAIVVALLSIVIVAAGTLVLGGASFVHLMTADGHPASEAQAMFDGSVRNVVAVAIVVAAVSALVLSIALGRRLAQPLQDVAAAARRIAKGDTAARVPRRGTPELIDVADSFNQMAASLEEQERLRREFIANAAHELRTPLTNLKGYLEALRDGVIAGDRATYESLWEEAERLVRLSHSLDRLADGDAPAARTLAEVDLGAAVQAATDLVAPSMGRAGLHLGLEIAAAPSVRADADLLAEVLANLLQNALRYTPSGGEVRVCLQADATDAVVSVSNTGPGIPAADLPRVFERFYRADKSRAADRGGAGIGLAIVREIVESIGGAVAVESRPGLTRFSVRLPVVQGSR